MIETITFLLAFAGFVLLAAAVVMSARGSDSRVLPLAAAVVIAAHVWMVWQFRYEWSYAQATRNGQAGFLIFHTALAAIISAPFASWKHAPGLLLFAFAAVSIGANGAVFRYDVVSIYRVPVIVTTVAGVALLVVAIKKGKPR